MGFAQFDPNGNIKDIGATGNTGASGTNGTNGTNGATGAQGPTGAIVFGIDGEDGEFLISQPGPQGNPGNNGVSVWNTVIKSSDTSRSNDAGSGANVVVADPELTFAMLANTKYSIRGFFYIQIDQASLGNTIRHRFTGPASPTTVIGEINRITDNLAFNPRIFNAYDAANQDIGAQGVAASAQKGVAWFNILVQNGVNAGNFTFSWVSGSSSANSATVLAGSYLEYIKI